MNNIFLFENDQKMCLPHTKCWEIIFVQFSILEYVSCTSCIKVLSCQSVCYSFVGRIYPDYWKQGLFVLTSVKSQVACPLIQWMPHWYFGLNFTLSVPMVNGQRKGQPGVRQRRGSGVQQVWACEFEPCYLCNLEGSQCLLNEGSTREWM